MPVLSDAPASPKSIAVCSVLAGVAGAQLEINTNIVIVPAASWLTVLWTLAWCAVMAIAAAAAFRRRAIS